MTPRAAIASGAGAAVQCQLIPGQRAKTNAPLGQDLEQRFSALPFSLLA